MLSLVLLLSKDVFELFYGSHMTPIVSVLQDLKNPVCLLFRMLLSTTGISHHVLSTLVVLYLVLMIHDDIFGQFKLGKDTIKKSSCFDY